MEQKQRFISQIMTSKSPVRSCDDVDEQALSYAEIKALCAGNPEIKEKMDLDVEVARLKVLKADHQSQQYRLEDRLLKYFPAELELQRGFIRGFEQDVATAAQHPLPKEGFVGISIRGQTFTDKDAAGNALLAICRTLRDKEPVEVGTYRGFTVEAVYNPVKMEVQAILKGAMTHRAALGEDTKGNLLRLDHALAAIPKRLEDAKAHLTGAGNPAGRRPGRAGQALPPGAAAPGKERPPGGAERPPGLGGSRGNRRCRSPRGQGKALRPPAPLRPGTAGQAGTQRT